MSLLPVGMPSMQGRMSSQSGNGQNDSAGFFDLIAAAVATQAMSQQTTAEAFEQGAFEMRSSLDNPPSSSSTHSLAGMISAHAELQALTARVGDVASTPIASGNAIAEMDALPRSNQPLDDASATIRHGTLPVIVSGQLVELALLSERRLARDSAPARRMSMMLDAAASGSLGVHAHLEGDCLVVRLQGDASAPLAGQPDYAEEVRALASRLGWQFTQMRWEYES